MMEWIRFIVGGLCILAGIATAAIAVYGLFKFHFAMNRMHAGGIGDTQGLFLIVLSIAVSAGSIMDAAKLFLLVIFMWNTSPVSSHFLSQIEYYTNPKLFDYMERL